MCGREFDFLDEQESFHFYSRLGYGSRYDNHTLRLDLCCKCMDQIIDSCKLSPVTDYG